MLVSVIVMLFFIGAGAVSTLLALRVTNRVSKNKPEETD